MHLPRRAALVLASIASIASMASLAPGQQPDDREVRLAQAIRRVRVVRDAEAVIVARLDHLERSPGVWCGIAVTRQFAVWKVEQTLAGEGVKEQVRVGHLLVAHSALVDREAPFLRPDLFWPGARAVLCLTRCDGDFVVLDEDYGVQLVDGPRHLDADKQAMLRAVLGSSALIPYLHLDAKPDRQPCVELGTLIPQGFEVAIAGHPIVFLPAELVGERNLLRVTACEIDGDRATLRFLMPREGIAGAIGFARNEGQWSITSTQIAER